jgi:hypothetical protein
MGSLLFLSTCNADGEPRELEAIYGCDYVVDVLLGRMRTPWRPDRDGCENFAHLIQLKPEGHAPRETDLQAPRPRSRLSIVICRSLSRSMADCKQA